MMFLFSRRPAEATRKQVTFSALRPQNNWNDGETVRGTDATRSVRVEFIKGEIAGAWSS